MCARSLSANSWVKETMGNFKSLQSPTEVSGGQTRVFFFQMLRRAVFFLMHIYRQFTTRGRKVARFNRRSFLACRTHVNQAKNGLFAIICTGYGTWKVRLLNRARGLRLKALVRTPDTLDSLSSTSSIWRRECRLVEVPSGARASSIYILFLFYSVHPRVFQDNQEGSCDTRAATAVGTNAPHIVTFAKGESSCQKRLQLWRDDCWAGQCLFASYLGIAFKREKHLKIRFYFLWSGGVGSRPGPSPKLDVPQEILMTLMKLKLALLIDDLAFKFMVSSTTASSIFTRNKILAVPLALSCNFYIIWPLARCSPMLEIPTYLSKTNCDRLDH